MRGPVGTADQQRFGGMESEKYRDTAARQARPARGGQRGQPRHRALVFRERERACGVSRHLSKPIDLTALHAALCEVLREN